jgi:hypothetical protein
LFLAILLLNPRLAGQARQAGPAFDPIKTDSVCATRPAITEFAP